MSSCFEVSLADKVAHVQMKRPDAYNSMTAEFWRELPEIINGISDDGEARAIVLSSTGKHFCAGMDLAVFTEGAGLTGVAPGVTETGRTNMGTRAAALLLQDSFNCLENARMPVLSAIQGGCIGGAVDMVTATDMRYATAEAFFCIQEINIAMTADVGTLQRLPKLIPEGVARELAYTGRRMPASEAKAVGLVNGVYDDQDAMLEGVFAIAAEIASKSPLAIWGTKESINYTRDHSVADSLKFIATWQAGAFQPGDMMEEFAAKAEKRPAEFENLPKQGRI